MVALLAGRLRSMDTQLADSVFLDVTGRTAKRLLELSADEDEFQLPITQEELAGMVGASRERRQPGQDRRRIAPPHGGQGARLGGHDPILSRGPDTGSDHGMVSPWCSLRARLARAWFD